MRDTAKESADLKQALKHEPVTDELRAQAEAHPLEAEEAIQDTETGLDPATPGSWVDTVYVDYHDQDNGDH
jgi:hypothetical protein